jgi:hypothetical protein
MEQEMSVARKRYNPDEREQIYSLHKKGFTYRDIADRVRPGVASAWRSIGDIVREMKREEEKAAFAAANPLPQGQPEGSGTVRQFVQVPTASKQSSITLPEAIQDSVTAKEIMTMLDDDMRTIFVATYEDLRGEADEEALTRAENDMLIRAAFAHAQYIRAAKMYNQCESFLMQELNGEFVDKNDPRKMMAGRGENYKKEMETRHKEYMELIDGLKLKRSQRLDKIKDTRNTFLDLQQELVSKVRQSSIIEDIKRINMATREELQRMAKGEVGPDGNKHIWLIGAFDDFTVSTPAELKEKIDEVTGERDTTAVGESRPQEGLELNLPPKSDSSSGERQA